ncbi:MAG TPA: TRAP transporter substrate-binding protein DctP [Steroidobacteraceae bacterium]|nr:TRAP transporter substrate-binding protein DctP [Steroidobacteraceae bacterium]
MTRPVENALMTPCRPPRRPAASLLACALAALALGPGAPPAARAESQVHIKLATIAPKGSVYHRVLQQIGAAIRQSEGDGATVTIYTDGSQGGEADVVRRMRIGQLNATMMSVVGLSSIEPSVSVLQKLPLLFRSTDEIDYVGQALLPQVEKNLLAKGFVAVQWSDAGWVRFFTKEPAALPADFKARRMFVWSGDPDQVEIMKQLGYRPVVLETADIVPGLQTGLVDTVPLVPMYALATQADSAAPYMIDVRWAPVFGAIVFSRQSWESMREATRSAVRAVAAQGGRELREYAVRADIEAVAAMQKRGLKVVHLSAEQERGWQAFAQQLYPLIRGRTLPAATFDEALKLVGEYRAQHPAAAGGAR